MNMITRIGLSSFLLGLYVGCSPVKFGLDDSKCNAATNCVITQNKYSYSYQATAGYGKVDILIVNDNSASMSFEQARLAPRFANFIADLDARKIDYRIAMITTDVSGTGELKGGSLIPFGSNAYLTPAVSNRVALFNQTIQRPETLKCEKFVADWIRNNGGNANSINTTAYVQAYAQHCPSGDERGVYAAHLAVVNNPQNFIRNDAHLSIIFISDEDERSGLYGDPNYLLEEKDQPARLVSAIQNKFGDAKFNSLSLHAVVVRDNACLAQQNAQVLDNYAPTAGLVSGGVGTVYLSFTKNGWGRSADICSNDYTTQLGQIRAEITDKIKDIMLNCSNPTDLVVTTSGAPVSHTLEGKILKFSQALAPGSSVSISYKCAALN